nr:adult cuticle protein 1-like [Aedes albopictus]
MKCFTAIVMMALAVAVKASHVTNQLYAHHGHGYVASPYGVYAAHHGSTIIQSNDDHHAWTHHGYWPAGASHSYVNHATPAVRHWDHHHGQAAPVLPHQHTATYVAANPGAVHKAPLPGHIVNQKSLNLAPASGLW